MPYLQAGTNNPFGFMPVEQAVGDAETHTYIVGTSGGPIYPGDVVTMGTGYLVDSAANTAASGGAALSGTGVNRIVGVAAQYQASAPSAQAQILVYDDPYQVFVVQDQGSATSGINASQGVFGNGVAINVTATPTLTGNAIRSRMVILASVTSTTRVSTTTNTSGGLPVMLLALHPIEFTPNAAASSVMPTASGQYRKWLVRFCNHLFSQGLGGQI